MRRFTSRSVTQLCSRNVILGSNGLKKLGLVSTFRKPQLATLATWSNFGGSAKMCISLRLWWTRGDSNPRPPRCERGALPAELLAHRFSLASDYTSMSYGQQVGTNWDNQIASFSAVALRFSGQKCVVQAPSKLLAFDLSD